MASRILRFSALLLVLGAGVSGPAHAGPFPASIPFEDFADTGGTMIVQGDDSFLNGDPILLGDLDGDGRPDLGLRGSFGSPRVDGLLILYGTPNGFPDTLNSDDLLTYRHSLIELCCNVDALGDINGDGIDDLGVRLPGQPGPNGTQSAGALFVVHGRIGGIANPFTDVELDGEQGWTLQGEEHFGRLGTASAGSFDLNADGIGDLAAIAPGIDNPDGADGAIFIVFGQTAPRTPVLTTAALDGTTGTALRNENLFDFEDAILTGGFDLNADGVDDLALGLGGSIFSGIMAVVFGADRAYGSTWSFDPQLGDGVVIQGDPQRDTRSFGGSLAPTGDFNGDGYGDLSIGAEASGAIAGNTIERGHAFVLFADPGPWPPSLMSSDIRNERGFRVRGARDRDYLGSVGAGGDLNGDGFSDFFATNGFQRIETYVIYGTDQPVTIDVIDEVDGETGFMLTGNITFRPSRAASAMSDFNGDGLDDLLIPSTSTDSFLLNGRSFFPVFEDSFETP
jgi:hypothetical protein